MVEQLKLFFAVNDVIVQFVHGQVFFVLGVAMGLQFFQRSRLDLARALPWLAIFGLFEAFATWGNTFIPTQEQILDAATIVNLRFLQLLVHLLCFASLLGFGIRLNEPFAPTWAAPTVPLIVVLLFGTVILIDRLLTNNTDIISDKTFEALMRYSVCIPAALLVAFGLRQQAGRLIVPLKVPRLVNVLRVAGFGFLFYALVEGVIVPAAPFFPANTINNETIFNSVGIPIGIFRSMVGAVIAWYMFRSLEAFRIEADRVADALENQQALATERERFSRDLHDGTLQNIYAAGLMIDDVKHALSLRQDNNHYADKQLENVIATLNKTNQDIRGYIYDLRHSVAGDEDLARGLLDIVTEFRLRTAIPTEWTVEGCASFQTSAEQRHQIYQIAREALSNIAKHSSATRAKVELVYENCQDEIAQSISLRISDNGKGATATARTGRGLSNMRERASLLGAGFEIESQDGYGTVVKLKIET